MALSFPETVESVEARGLAFQVAGKPFANLFPRDQRWAEVMLPPKDSRLAAAGEPELFAPQRGGWFRHGFTQVNLAKAGEHTVISALTAAWRHVAPKRLLTKPTRP